VADSDVNGVTIFTASSFDVSGRVTVDGRAARSNEISAMRISLWRSSPQGGRARPSSSFSRPLADASFHLDARLGDFQINIQDLPPNGYVKSIRLGKVEVVNS